MVIDYQGIGKRLSSARENMGMSIEDVSQKTRIQLRYLQALENGDVDQLPGSFYVKAFIRQYANTVKLDPNTIFEKYTYPNRDELEEQNDVLDQPVLDETRVVVGKDMLTHSGMKGISKTFLEKIQGRLPAILLSVLVIAAVFVVWISVSSIKPTDNKSASTSVKTSSTSVPSSSSSSKKSSSSSSSESTAELIKGSYNGSTVNYSFADSKEHTIIIQSAGNAWTTVNLDGQRNYAGTITNQAPQVITVPAETKEVIIHSGNPTQLTIMFDDKDIAFRDGAPTLTTDIVFNRN